MLARPITTDEWQVLVRLERWTTQIDALLEVLGDGSNLNAASVEHAREMFGVIKRGLRTECEDGAKYRRYEALNEIERQWYVPTIRATYCSLRSKLNTKPGPIWSAELREARGVIAAAIDRLKDESGAD